MNAQQNMFGMYTSIPDRPLSCRAGRFDEQPECRNPRDSALRFPVRAQEIVMPDVVVSGKLSGLEPDQSFRAAAKKRLHDTMGLLHIDGTLVDSLHSAMQQVIFTFELHFVIAQHAAIPVSVV